MIKSEDELIVLSSRLHELYVEYGRLAPIKASLERLRKRDNGASHGGIIAIVGETRSGKSKLVQDYVAGFPEQPKAIRTADGWADRREVILFGVPQANAKNVWESMYSTLTGIKTTSMVGMKASSLRRYDFRETVPELAEAMENRLMIFDECHQAVDDKTDRVAKDVAVMFKDLSNRGRFSLVLVGTPKEVRRLIAAKKELASRVLRVHEILPFSWEVEEDRKDFLDILSNYDEFLVGVFGRLSGLNQMDTALRILIACRGVIGIAAKLIEEAAMEAGYEFLAGKADAIGWKHLAAAFDHDEDNQGRPNPFRIPAGSVVRQDPAPDLAEVSVPMKLRRAESEAALNKR